MGVIAPLTLGRWPCLGGALHIPALISTEGMRWDRRGAAVERKESVNVALVPFADEFAVGTTPVSRDRSPSPSRPLFYVLLLTLVAVSGSAATSPWPHVGYDASHTGVRLPLPPPPFWCDELCALHLNCVCMCVCVAALAVSGSPADALIPALLLHHARWRHSLCAHHHVHRSGIRGVHIQSSVCSQWQHGRFGVDIHRGRRHLLLAYTRRVRQRLLWVLRHILVQGHSGRHPWVDLLHLADHVWFCRGGHRWQCVRGGQRRLHEYGDGQRCGVIILCHRHPGDHRACVDRNQQLGVWRGDVFVLCYHRGCSGLQGQ